MPRVPACWRRSGLATERVAQPFCCGWKPRDVWWLNAAQLLRIVLIYSPSPSPSSHPRSFPCPVPPPVPRCYPQRRRWWRKIPTKRQKKLYLSDQLTDADGEHLVVTNEDGKKLTLTRDPQKALGYLSAAAATGHVEAMFQAALLHADAGGLGSDEHQALTIPKCEVSGVLLMPNRAPALDKPSLTSISVSLSYPLSCIMFTAWCVRLPTLPFPFLPSCRVCFAPAGGAAASSFFSPHRIARSLALPRHRGRDPA